MLIAALASTTRMRVGSFKKGGCRIRLAPFYLQVIKEFAKLYASNIEQFRELSLGEQILPVRFGCQHVEPQRRRTVGIGFLTVDYAQIAQHLLDVLIGNSAVSLKPVPGSLFDESEFFESAHHCLARNAKAMHKDYYMPTRKPVRARRHFLKLLHDGSGGREECSCESISIPLFARGHDFIRVQHFRQVSGGNKVTAFMRCGLGAARSRMVGIQQHARTEVFVVSEQARNPAVQASHINTHSHFHFEQRHDVRDRSVAQTEALAKFECVVLGLRLNIPAQNRTLGRIVPGPLYSKQVLQFDLCFHEVRHD